MPQLSSGRHVALSASPYLDAVASEKDESKYFAIVALRLHASTREALRDHLVIGYFVEGQGTPPNAPTYNSGYALGDVLEGRTDWRPDEVDDLREFVERNPRFQPWLQAEFAAIDEAIRTSPVWASGLLADAADAGDIDVSTIKRAIIERSASEPGAMAQLRRPKGNASG